jgi:hypothetical protein
MQIILRLVDLQCHGPVAGRRRRCHPIRPGFKVPHGVSYVTTDLQDLGNLFLNSYVITDPQDLSCDTSFHRQAATTSPLRAPIQWGITALRRRDQVLTDTAPAAVIILIGRRQLLSAIALLDGLLAAAARPAGVAGDQQPQRTLGRSSTALALSLVALMIHRALVGLVARPQPTIMRLCLDSYNIAVVCSVDTRWTSRLLTGLAWLHCCLWARRYRWFAHTLLFVRW